ncbi:MAG TPA: phosphatase PAP2 family protein [Gemmatimonadaceae bacterium]|jgi:membrane-associated phospholipid phosphatase
MISTDTSANVINGTPPPHDGLGERAGKPQGLTWRDPRAAALAWLAAYLAIAGVMLLVHGSWGLATLHVVLIAVIFVARAPGNVIGDFLPLVVAPALYGEIPALIAAAGTTYHDALVQRWELALFGTQPSHTLASWLPNIALSELLHAGYLSYYAVLFVPALLLYARRRRGSFAATVLTLTLTCTICWGIFVAMPVEGPRYLFSAPPNIPDGPLRRLAVSLLAAGSSRGAAFPSSHMAVSVAMAVTALRWQRRTGWVVLAAAILIGFGAVYGGFHYGVDMIAGAALGLTTSLIVIATFNTARWESTGE